MEDVSASENEALCSVGEAKLGSFPRLWIQLSLCEVFSGLPVFPGPLTCSDTHPT